MKKIKTVSLYTEAGEQLTGQPWNTYPRPQMRRDSFLCLNGEWEFSANGGAWESIRVPFAPESLLSGIKRDMGKCPHLVYRRHFSLPDGFRKGRVLLHFGAVDQICFVTLNGALIGEHSGGYDAFCFDITEYLAEDNVLEVNVTDELERHILPYGKQRRNRGGMWYTPVSGIWQTVWCESVPDAYIDGLDITTGADFADITVSGASEGLVTMHTPEGDKSFPLESGHVHIPLDAPRLWSPENPYLYEFSITAGEDEVHSYFALRTLSVETVNGISRLCLNGTPYFFHGLLDQGYFSDGILTPATPECYERDILAAKSLGFNTLRKHIKVEPEQFYYDCDRLGMIIFQDMVNNGGYSFLRDTALPTVGMKKLPDKWMHPSKETREAFGAGMQATVRQLKNHPCICYWTIFNEGWGQFDSKAQYEALKKLDDSRFIDTASGWFSGAPSDVESPHVYFKPIRIKPSPRPILLSEFGGYSYKPEGHVFNPYKTYGYRFFEAEGDFRKALVKLYEDEILPAIPKGLCGAIYTQLSDVEDETNGLLSYDRRVVKVDKTEMQMLAGRLKSAIEG